ncbi:MAG: SGNH/GDSL hydrolase family protein [Acidobacteriota bacterium]
MNLVINPSKRMLVALAATFLFSLATAQAQNSQPAASETTARPLNMLVLGDSIAWGQGLKDEHKAWHQVKAWLRQTTGREVHEKIEAHSGAVIGSAEERQVGPSALLDGEVNRAVPTVNEQIDTALKSYADASQVDLVLVDGCINDVDARRLLNAVNTPDEIHRAAEAKCGILVESLLHRIIAVFPKAHVIVTGYFPIISEKTKNDFFMRALAKRLYTPSANGQQMNDKELRARLIAISREWYESSNYWLAAGTGKVDAQLSAHGSRRVLFAPVTFLPEHSFRARESRLWGFDASFLRRLLVVLTLGKVALRTNDERRNQRNASCKEVFKPFPGETKEEKRAREGRLMLCRIAAIGHPNRKGAVMYAEAISRQLQSLIANSGWLTSPRAPAGNGNHVRQD